VRGVGIARVCPWFAAEELGEPQVIVRLSKRRPEGPPIHPTGLAWRPDPMPDRAWDPGRDPNPNPEPIPGPTPASRPERCRRTAPEPDPNPNPNPDPDSRPGFRTRTGDRRPHRPLQPQVSERLEKKDRSNTAYADPAKEFHPKPRRLPGFTATPFESQVIPALTGVTWRFLLTIA
jgi:hypothetical protein